MFTTYLKDVLQGNRPRYLCSPDPKKGRTVDGSSDYYQVNTGALSHSPPYFLEVCVSAME